MSDREARLSDGMNVEEPTYSHWRVWVDANEVRVARDWYKAPPPGPQLQPQHLELVERSYISWRPHEQGAIIPSIEMSDFIAWLDQGGAV